MRSIVFSVCGVAAALFWLVFLTMGGLEIVQQANGLGTEHAPLEVALYALVPAAVLSAFAYAAWRWRRASSSRRTTGSVRPLTWLVAALSGPFWWVFLIFGSLALLDQPAQGFDTERAEGRLALAALVAAAAVSVVAWMMYSTDKSRSEC